ncbi:hypothetical protein EU528_12795 [Candidatus Thorarchaeota archaeon]|nr:MAG: hypothetical protein EU528_12795 [Candidatus Thorarchaeota archaeon]
MVDDLETLGESFTTYFKRSRLLKVGLAFNVIYYISVIIGLVFFLIQGTLFDTVYTVDFRVFFEAGQVFRNSPGDIYLVNPNGLPFRYFPSFAAFMSVFSDFPILILYLIDISLMMVFNFGIVYFVYLICLQMGVTPVTKNFEKTLVFVLIAPQHIINIIFGQITQLAILLALIVLFLLQSSKHDSFNWFIAIGLLIGIASTLKPFFLILIPFLIPITVMKRSYIVVPLRQLAGVVSGILLTMLPNIVYFILYPTALNDIIQVNLFENLTGQHSTSITNLILALIPSSDIFPLRLAIILILGGFISFRSYIQFIKTPESQKNYLRHFTDMMFVVLLVYPDSWFLFLAVWYVFLAPSMLHLYSKESLPEKESRRLDILWPGANNLLAFFSFGIVIHYFVLGFDPINPIWLAILYIMYTQISDSVFSITEE